MFRRPAKGHLGIAMIRFLIAVAAIGLMSLSAFAQDLSGTKLAGTPEQNEIVRKASAERIKAGAKTCVACDLFQVDLSYQELPNRDLSSSRLRQADLSLTTFDRAKFANANLSIVNAFGARFENADFSNANLSDATLVGAWLGGANLSGANLSNANLSGAYLATARNLSQVQLNVACGDASTELPKGLTLAHCKAAGVEVRQVPSSQTAPDPAPAIEPPPSFAQPPSAAIIPPAQTSAQPARQVAGEAEALAGAPSPR